MEIRRMRRTLLEGGGRREEQAKRSWMGKSWTCWGNGPEVEVTGAGEPGVMEGDTGRSEGAGLERGCCGEECGFCSEVHKP